MEGEMENGLSLIRGLIMRLLWRYVDNNYLCIKMEVKMKVNSNSAYSGKVRGTISDKVKDRSNDPFIVKKTEAAKRDIEKYGFPAELLKIQAERLKK